MDCERETSELNDASWEHSRDAMRIISTGYKACMRSDEWLVVTGEFFQSYSQKVMALQRCKPD
jgi:hypothetical protein